MEEIDIIELLKRVKEGKAPKVIEIGGEKFILRDLKKPLIECLYYKEEDDGDIINWLEDVIYIDTKIKILDKPIIEEFNITYEDGFISHLPDNFEIIGKINEIIRVINNKE